MDSPTLSGPAPCPRSGDPSDDQRGLYPSLVPPFTHSAGPSKLKRRRVSVEGSRDASIQAAMTEAERASRHHQCTQTLVPPSDHLPGTQVDSLRLLSNPGQFHVAGHFHFRVSPGGVTLRCLHCRERILFSVATSPSHFFLDSSHAVPICLEDEVHVLSPGGDTQVVRHCQNTPGLASMSVPWVIVQPPFWLVNTQLATICRGWSQVLPPTVVNSLRASLEGLKCGLYGRSRHNSVTPHWVPSHTAAERFIQKVQPVVDIIGKLYQRDFLPQYRWVEQQIPSCERVFGWCCLCYYNQVTSSGAQLSTREVASIHTDPDNLSSLSFVVPLGDWSGGRTRYPDYRFISQVVEGDVYALEATSTRHMVETVTAGTRFSLVFFTKRTSAYSALSLQ